MDRVDNSLSLILLIGQARQLGDETNFAMEINCSSTDQIRQLTFGYAIMIEDEA